MRTWSILLLVIAFCGCESVIDLEIPSDYQPKLVVESHFSPDSLWTFRVGKSIQHSETIDPAKLIVPDARIVILGEDSFRDTLEHRDGGIYQTAGDDRPLSGIRYEVQVDAPGFEQVEASSLAPILESEFFHFERLERIDSIRTERYVLRFRIMDQPGKNYFTLNLSQVVPFCKTEDSWIRIEDDPGYATRYSVIPFRSQSSSFHAYVETVDDPVFPNLDNEFWTAYFSDQLFEATTQEFEITFEPMIFESIPPRFMLVLSVLSDDLFAFERSLVIHDYFFYGPNISRSSPPVVYSNVNRGLGIFAGYTNNTYRFDSEGNDWTEESIGLGTHDVKPCQ